jgi:hypothetical protein
MFGMPRALISTCRPINLTEISLFQLSQQSGGKRLAGRPRLRWEVNIKTDSEEGSCNHGIKSSISVKD